MIALKRASLPGGKWLLPVKPLPVGGKGKLVLPTVLPEFPVRKIVPVSIENVEEDFEPEASPDDPSELSLEEKPLVAGVEEPEEQEEAQEVEAQDGD
jgi:hypothetical protein